MLWDGSLDLLKTNSLQSHESWQQVLRRALWTVKVKKNIHVVFTTLKS
jgi:hypothetical protein